MTGKMIPDGTVIQKGGAGEISAGIPITDAGVKKTNGILATTGLKMTDSQRVIILLNAIRCVLAAGKGNDLNMRLVKSVLLEAMKQCGEECEEVL